MNKIKVLGKEYPMRVTMGALRDFKREYGKDISEVGNDMDGLTLFMYCCVRSACRADLVVFDLEVERFADGVDLEEFAKFQNQIATPGDAKKKKA